MEEFTRKAPPAGPHPDGGWCSACDRDPEYHFKNPSLEELRNDVRGTFIDAFGDTDGADDLFDDIVSATENRIIALLESTPATRTTMMEDGPSVYALGKEDYIALIKGENE